MACDASQKSIMSQFYSGMFYLPSSEGVVRKGGVDNQSTLGPRSF